MILGLGTQFTQNNDQNIPAREAYVQDSVKVSPRLTLMFGARWQPHFGVSPTGGNFVTFRPGQSSTIYPTAPVGLVTRGRRRRAVEPLRSQMGEHRTTRVVCRDISETAKPLCAAATPGQRTTRICFRSTLIPSRRRTVSHIARRSATRMSWRIHISTRTAVACRSLIALPGGQSTKFNAGVSTPVNTLGMDPNYNSGQIHQWNFTFDFEPVKSYLISVGYVATREHTFPRMLGWV